MQQRIENYILLNMLNVILNIFYLSKSVKIPTNVGLGNACSIGPRFSSDSISSSGT